MMNNIVEEIKKKLPGRRTVVYTQCRIHGKRIKTLLDTGADVSLIENGLRTELGAKIVAAAKGSIDGIGSATPLGWVHDLPVTFGRVMVEGDMLVCDKAIMKNQDLLLGTPWIDDAGMIMDFRKKEIRLVNRKGREQRIPMQIYQDREASRGETNVDCFIAQMDLDLNEMGPPPTPETAEPKTESDIKKN